MLTGALVLALLSGLSLAAAPARAGNLGSSDQLVLAALAGVQPLPVDEMAKQSARGFENGQQMGVHLPITEPTVQLWDDVGTVSPSSIGNTVVTITAGPGQ